MAPDIYDQARDALYGCSLTGSRCIFVGATAKSNATVTKGDRRYKGTAKINLMMLVNGIMVNSQGTSTFTCTQ